MACEVRCVLHLPLSASLGDVSTIVSTKRHGIYTQTLVRTFAVLGLRIYGCERAEKAGFFKAEGQEGSIERVPQVRGSSEHGAGEAAFYGASAQAVE